MIRYQIQRRLLFCALLLLVGDEIPGAKPKPVTSPSLRKAKAAAVTEIYIYYKRLLPIMSTNPIYPITSILL